MGLFSWQGSFLPNYKNHRKRNVFSPLSHFEVNYHTHLRLDYCKDISLLWQPESFIFPLRTESRSPQHYIRTWGSWWTCQNLQWDEPWTASYFLPRAPHQDTPYLVFTGYWQIWSSSSLEGPRTRSKGIKHLKTLANEKILPYIVPIHYLIKFIDKIAAITICMFTCIVCM